MNARLLEHGNKKTVRDVPAKAKVAIAVLLTQPKQDLEAAATAAGLQTYMLRRYLGRPEVRNYFRKQQQILVDAIVAGNAVALKDIRDNSGNQMARVNAARALQLMQNEMDDPHYANRNTLPAAGITIVIEAGATAKVLGPVVDVTPQPAPEFEGL
jgi:hypothetical protein